MTKMLHAWIPVLATMISGCAIAPDADERAEPGASPQTESEPQAASLTPEDAALARKGLPDHCFARVDGNVSRVDLAAETITATPDHGFGGFDLTSLGLTQNHLVGCALGEPVHILDLATGVVTSVELSCEAVTAIGDKVYVLSGDGQELTEYANLRALIARQSLRSLPPPFASRLGAGNGRLLASWHSANEVLAVDLASGDEQAIPLPGYDGWIFGLFENAKVRLVNGGWFETGINIYNTTSGKQIGRVFDGIWLEGLACSNSK